MNVYISTRLSLLICFLILNANAASGQLDSLKEAGVIFHQEPFQIFTEQEEDVIAPTLYLSTSMTEDGLMIRWAPNQINMWLDGIDNGYVLERRLVPVDSTQITIFEPVSNMPLKPWNKKQWEEIVKENKPYCAIAAQSIFELEKTPYEGFVANQENQNNLFGFNLVAADLDREAAIASGLGYLDQSIKKDDMAVYRIRLQASPLSNYLDTIFSLGIASQNEIPAPRVYEAKEFELAVQLNWDNQIGRSAYTAFHIERSSDGINFNRITELPFLPVQTEIQNDNFQVSYIDSLVSNDVPYFYRIIGINGFAQLSEPSEIIKAMGRDRTPPNTPINLTSQENDKGFVVINWDWRDLNNDNDLLGFHVLKSNNAGGVFDTLTTKLLPPNTKKYIDDSPDLVQTNFYKIIAIDGNGNYSESAFSFVITEDNIAPAPPKNLEAFIDSTGKMLLTWDSPADKDVRGYLVHFSNGKDANFAVIPGDYLVEPYYIDSLNLQSLTEEIYYYVVALDLNYNASEISEIVEVKKPDIIPPAPSIFVDYKVSEEGIFFEWRKSQSDDVTEVRLLKKAEGQDWEIVKSFDSNTITYKDLEVQGGKLYQYQLVTIDDSGNKTESAKPLTLEALTPFFIPQVQNFTLNKKDDQIEITWEYPQMENFQFILFRQIGDEAMKTLTKLSGKDSFQEKLNLQDVDIKYAIKVKAKDGRESVLSDFVSTIN